MGIFLVVKIQFYSCFTTEEILKMKLVLFKI